MVDLPQLPCTSPTLYGGKQMRVTNIHSRETKCQTPAHATTPLAARQKGTYLTQNDGDRE
jgi:hypothetical protein